MEGRGRVHLEARNQLIGKRGGKGWGGRGSCPRALMWGFLFFFCLFFLHGLERLDVLYTHTCTHTHSHVASEGWVRDGV